MHEERQIVYLAGVPGVGKTTQSRAFAENHAHWRRVGGGEMLAEARNHQSVAERDMLRALNGGEILGNQYVIVQMFTRMLETETRHIVFDGHCHVRRAHDRKLQRVPTEIVRLMRITKVVYLAEPPEVILARRAKDTERPGRDVETPDDLVLRLKRGEEACRWYARKLGIPYVGLVSPTPDAFADAIMYG